MFIFHITSGEEWKKALEVGSYRADSLQSQGFIHCCFAQQKAGVLDRYFKDRNDLMMLTLNTEKLASELKLENLEGGQEVFPHVYGEINLDAVTACRGLDETQNLKLVDISPERFKINPYAQWEHNWLLLTAGDLEAGEFNAMTVAWGSLGCLWNKPFVQIFVRPTRHTFTLLEKFPTFSLCAFPAEFRSALSLLGSKSGRDSQKMRDSGLTIIPAEIIQAPVYEEADLVIECKTIYQSEIFPDKITAAGIDALYPLRDFHRILFCEILNIRGIEKFNGSI